MTRTRDFIWEMIKQQICSSFPSQGPRPRASYKNWIGETALIFSIFNPITLYQVSRSESMDCLGHRPAGGQGK